MHIPMTLTNTKLAITSLAILTTILMTSNLIPSAMAAPPESKVDICHFNSEFETWNTINVANAQSHLDNHAYDYAGACSVDHDADGDGVSDVNDSCPIVAANTVDGCPIVIPPEEVDETAPEISVDVSCSEEGNNGWCVGDVTVTWTVTDEESDVTTEGCEDTVVDYDVTALILSCEATSEGGTDSLDTDPINRDATSPEITGEATEDPNLNDWYNTEVTVEFTCTDATSGPVDSFFDVFLDVEGADQTASGICEDLAGNTASLDIDGINIDMTAPEINVEQDGTYILGQPVEFECSDSLSGIDECNATLDTSSVGPNTGTVSATDLAGNESSEDVTYSVGYGCLDNGFKSPIPNTTYKVGRAVPEKFVACDYDGVPVPNVVASSLVDGNPATSSGNSNTGNLFRYDATAGQYIFNMKSDGLALGSHILKAVLDSGQEITASVTFTK